jgi:hypothetical protein
MLIAGDTLRMVLEGIPGFGTYCRRAFNGEMREVSLGPTSFAVAGS